MASDLVLRILQVDPKDGGFSSDLHINTRIFVSACYDVLYGFHTLAAVKLRLGLTPTEDAQLDIIVGKITSAVDLFHSAARIARIDDILTIWENDKDHTIASYTTPDEVETHLLSIDTEGDI